MLIRRGTLRELWRRHGRPHGRPRLAAASDREFWQGADAGIRATILGESDRMRADAWPQPLLSQWAAYVRTGDRAAYEAANFTRNRRVRLAVLAAALDATPKRLSEAADGLWFKAEQTTWCWPAHDDAFARGLMVPDTARPCVDLGAGEDAALIAWSVLVLGERLDEFSPGLRDRLAAEVRTRVLEPFVVRRDWPWEGTEEHVHNWAPWIHSNLLPAAVAFADDELRAQVFALCVDGLDRYLAQLPADGAIDEGFGYWWQGAARAFDALALLDDLSDGAIRRALPSQLGGLAELARFPQRMRLGHGWFASFSDAEARADAGVAWHALFRAARLCGLDDVAAFAAAERSGPLCGLDDGVHAGLGRMLAELADREWAAAATVSLAAEPVSWVAEPVSWAAEPVSGVAEPVEAPEPGSLDGLGTPHASEPVLLSSIGLGIRSSEGITVVAKGGHNGENHNHNDLGSIAVAVGGIPLLPDLGRAEYTAQTFSDRRWELWNVRSDWHSAPMPRGARQLPGAQWRAELTAIEAGWTIELADAYPEADPWKRTVVLADGMLRVVDEGAAVADPATRIVVVCTGVPASVEGGLLVPGREGSPDLLLTHDTAGVEIETVEVVDPHLRTSWGDTVSRILFAPECGSRWEMRGEIR
ncbi:heparinase II/III family protein [Microbacterium sp. KUDC0406]|uniref:heparinase II/III family protein n=1 Tax=Microbacterium sp. KUDC0406 TaxID=2909588 RepID=UPI001F3E603C|nr:heparinase II/III family protein [Microbacterium sp. KUDC0406]UJP10089.1 heparinase II/III family protein [Microbacterium sp. KUDC0406]